MRSFAEVSNYESNNPDTANPYAGGKFKLPPTSRMPTFVGDVSSTASANAHSGARSIGNNLSLSSNSNPCSPPKNKPSELQNKFRQENDPTSEHYWLDTHVQETLLPTLNRIGMQVLDEAENDKMMEDIRAGFEKAKAEFEGQRGNGLHDNARLKRDLYLNVYPDLPYQTKCSLNTIFQISGLQYGPAGKLMNESDYAIAEAKKTKLDNIHDKVDAYIVQPVDKICLTVAKIGFAASIICIVADLAATKMGGAVPYFEPTCASGVQSLVIAGIGFLGMSVAGNINDTGHELATKKLKAQLRENGEAMNQDMKLFNACVREQDKPNRLFRSVVMNSYKPV